MIEHILHTDQSLLLAINQGLQNAFLDALCPFMRKQSNWYPVYGVAVFFIIRQFKTQALWLLLGAALLVLFSDQISANLIKNSVQRLRPCNDPSIKDSVRALVGCGSGYSFVSAHAANHFAIAVYLYKVWGKSYRWFLPVAITWAALIAFSQVYVGVHYPADVIAGAIIGTMLAMGMALAITKFKLITLTKS